MHNKSMVQGVVHTGGSASRPQRRSLRSLFGGVLVACGAVLTFLGCAPGEQTGTFTILDDGTGAQLCDEVMESYPPQCHGTPVIDWSWEGLAYEEAQGVRWGMYSLSVQPEGESVRVELLATTAAPHGASASVVPHVTRQSQQ